MPRLLHTTSSGFVPPCWEEIVGGQSVLQNVNVYKNEGESRRRPTPTHATYFWTVFLFFLSLSHLRRLLFWRARGLCNHRPLLLSSAAHRYGNIGGAALLLSSAVSHGASLVRQQPGVLQQWRRFGHFRLFCLFSQSSLALPQSVRRQQNSTS